jgi:hypothetical protein
MSRRYSFWRLSASVCVGLRQDSRRVEWELLPVATAQLTLFATFGMNVLTHKTERGRQDRALFAIPVSFVRKRGSPIPRGKTKRVLGQMAKSNFRVRRLWVRFLHAALMPAIESLAIDITSERHHFGASAPEPNPQKTGAAHSSATSSEAAAAFNLNGQSLG